MIFEAKVDLWFLAVFYGSGLAMLIGAPWCWRHPSGKATSILLATIGVLFVCVGWRTSSVDYVLSEDGYLDATGWPFDGRITALSAIRSVEPSNDGRASHAASLDRLRIDHGRNGLIFIAVYDKAAFLDALVERETSLVRTETGVRRER